MAPAVSLPLLRAERTTDAIWDSRYGGHVHPGGIGRRDVGSPLFSLPVSGRPESYEPSLARVWRIPVVRDLWDRRVSLLVWAVGLSALGAVFVVLTKSVVQPLLTIPALTRYFSSFLTGDVYSSFFGYIWFGFAQLLMAGFAITQVARWSAEDMDGRLELILSTPVSRGRIVIER